ncbi:MAG TPA: sigma factor-like helix-turn-helix DNA-binding protein [Streptosporangiaceae bacterium]|nr:sigma factor-like helix-turn-helix DNA-binding protein [Streptosporangiaceae bacterium]
MASVMAMVAAALVPGRLPAEDGGGQAPELRLRAIAESLTRAGNRSASAGSKSGQMGQALVFRPWPARSLLVVGDSLLADEFRRLLMAGAVPGWDLHPVPGGRTPLHVLAGPLHRLSGSIRFYNLLEREGFAWAEDVAATPDGCLLELRNSGPKFIAAVRQVLAGRGSGGSRATAGGLAQPGLRALTGTWLPDGGLAQLARDLLGEIGERRRLILTSRTFAPGPRTYDSLAAELGVSRERVRQLETSALQQLGYAAGDDRYRPLRWRAASAAQPGSAGMASIPGAPTWTDQMLTWLAGKTSPADG